MEDQTSKIAAASSHVNDDSACIECGYALRGLRLTADCPECGLAVRVSRARLAGISSRQFCVLCLRICAVVLILLSLTGDVGLIDTLLWLFIEDNFSSYSSHEFVWFVASPLIKIGVGVGLWLAAPLIAGLVAPQSLPLIANIGGSRNAMRLVAAAFAMWMMVTGAESLIAAFTAYSLEQNLVATAGVYGSYYVLFARGFFRLIVGIFFLGWLINRRKLEI